MTINSKDEPTNSNDTLSAELDWQDLSIKLPQKLILELTLIGKLKGVDLLGIIYFGLDVYAEQEMAKIVEPTTK